MTNFSDLKGKTITSVEGLGYSSDLVTFKCSDGSIYKMYHYQDCCESVDIEDLCGDIDDILNSEILVAEEVDGETPNDFDESQYESYTWTFYKLNTIKGGITIRWFGSSNGCYSESVEFEKVES
jgi:hypothetical protein